jgi:hypothetical protein
MILSSPLQIVESDIAWLVSLVRLATATTHAHGMTSELVCWTDQLQTGKARSVPRRTGVAR